MKRDMRIKRINDELKREIAKIIDHEIKDPRLKSMTSVTKVDTTNDLKYSKVYVTIFAKDEEEKKASLEALDSASRYIRKEIASRVNLRITPEFKFILDDSLDYSDKIERLIKKTKKSERED